MQTNNVFSAGRFGLYMRKHLMDNYRVYGMSVIVLTVLLLVLLIFIVLNDGGRMSGKQTLVPLYFIGMFFSGLIFTSLSFNELGTKQQGIDYLLFPASQLEKYLSTLLVTTVGFLLVYHVAFYLAYVLMDSMVLWRTGIHMTSDMTDFLNDKNMYYAYIGWFIVQAFMLLGAIWFQKYTFIKTVFLVVVFLFSLYFINTIFSLIYFGDRMPKWNAHFPFVGVDVMLGEHPSEYEPQTHKFLMLPEAMRDTLLFFGKYLVTPILWAIGYMRLRDKEM